MPESETIVLPADAEIPPTQRADLPAIWESYSTRLEKLRTTAETLVVTDASQKAEIKIARESRLALKNLRVEIEKKRKELGEEALRTKQRIDSDAKALIVLIEPLEEKLLQQEKFIEIQERKERDERIATRSAELAPYTNPSLYNLGDMEADTYATVLADAKAAYDAKIEEQERRQAEQMKREMEQAKERRRIEQENARLKKEAEVREAQIAAERKEAEEKARIEREKMEAEHRAIEEAARKEREALEAKAKAEREEQERIAAEERRAAAERERIEREAREKVEAELRAREAAETKAKKEAAEAAKKAAQAPDREKLAAFIAQVEGLPLPKFTTEAGTAVGIAAASLVAELARGLKTHLSTL